MGAACPIIGMVAFAKFSLTDPQVLIATGLLSVTLFVGAIVIAWVSRWRRKQENETYTTHDNLAAFRVLYERGELSAEEFERIKKQLLGRLKQESAGPAKPSAPQAPSTAITDAAAQPQPPLPPEANDQSSDR